MLLNHIEPAVLSPGEITTYQYGHRCKIFGLFLKKQNVYVSTKLVCVCVRVCARGVCVVCGVWCVWCVCVCVCACVRGVRVRGVRCAVCGVRCAVCGVRCAVCGVRCAVCGVWCV